jgi:hypothetical protein
MMNFSLKQTFALVLITTLALAYFLSMNTNYPFYFIWDMDHTTTVDLLLIQSGELPDHINHTGYGMYLLLKWLHVFSAKLGLVSILNLTDLSASIQPILGVAELTDSIRRVSPVLVLSVAITLGLSLYKLTNRFFLVCGGLLVFLTFPSLLYHAAFVRSELYAIFLFAIAVSLIAKAARTSYENSNAWIVLVVSAGFFAGLSYLTKFQGIFYFIFVPVFYCFLEDFYQNKRWTQLPKRLSNSHLRVVAKVNFLLMLILILGAIFRHARGATFTEEYRINIVGSGYILFSALLFISVLPKWKNRFCFPFIHLYFFGFHLTFLSHFLMYANPNTSIKHLLLDAKMIFFRNTYYQSYSRLGVFDYFKSVLPYTIEQIPFLFCSFLAVAAFHLYLSVGKQKKYLSAILTLIVFANTLIASRGILRDLIWIEILLSLALIIFSFDIIKIWKFIYSHIFVIGIFAFLIFFNVKRSATIPTDTDANFNNYGWKIDKSFYSVYQQIPFQLLMAQRYPPNIDKAPSSVSRMARNYREHRRAAKFTFPNLDVGVKNIGYFYENSPIDSFGFWRVKEFSPELREGFLVDNFYLPRSKTSLMPNAAAGESEGYTKIEQRDEKYIGVLNRPDYAVYLFLPEESIAAVKGGNIRSSDLFVNVESLGNKSRTFKAVEIFNYVEIDPFAYGKAGFFAILPKN